MSKLVVNSSRAPGVTNVTNSAIVEILPPEPKLSAIEPVCQQAVIRIVQKALHNLDLPRYDYTSKVAWYAKSGDQFVVAIEHGSTAVRYLWTVCPHTYKPKCLGPVND